MMAQGSWSMYSEKDPRWNCNGTGMVGMFSTPHECQEKIDELTESLGEPPEDLEVSYMKY